MSRARSDLSLEEIARFDDALFLVDKKETERVINHDRLDRIAGAVCAIPCVGQGPKGRDAPASDASGLVQLLRIKHEAKVMLVANLSTRHGLVNGATGVVKKILFDPLSENPGPPGIPAAVVVQFPGYRGPAWDAREPQWVPISVHSAEWPDSSGGSNRRQQIPLCLCFACTIHKSQGMTLNMAAVDTGEREWSQGLTYVALSRLKTLEGLLISPMNPVTYRIHRWRGLGGADGKRLKNRQDEERRLRRLGETDPAEQHLQRPPARGRRGRRGHGGRGARR